MSTGFILHGSPHSLPTYRAALMLRLSGIGFSFHYISFQRGMHRTPEFRARCRDGGKCRCWSIRHGCWCNQPPFWNIWPIRSGNSSQRANLRDSTCVNGCFGMPTG